MKRHISKVKTMVMDKKYEDEKKYFDKVCKILYQPLSNIQALLTETNYSDDFDFSLIKGLVIAFSKLSNDDLMRCKQGKYDLFLKSDNFVTQKMKDLCKKKDFTGLKKEIHNSIARKFYDSCLYYSKLLTELSYLYVNYIQIHKKDLEFVDSDVERLQNICEILMFDYYYCNSKGITICTPESEKKEDLVYVTFESFDDCKLSDDTQLNLFTKLYDNVLNYMTCGDMTLTKEKVVDLLFTFESQEESNYFSLVKERLRFSLFSSSFPSIPNEHKNLLFNVVYLNTPLYMESLLQNIKNELTNGILMLCYNDLALLRDTENIESNQQIKELKSEMRSVKKESSQKDKQISELNLEIEKSKKIVEEQLMIQQTNSHIIELENETKELRDTLSSIKSAKEKIILKCEHQEQVISELHNELKEFTTLESDMMYLQNENNLMKLDIDRLEDTGLDADTELKEYNKKLAKISDIPILFVGGVGNMMAKFKSLFPNSDYIDVSNEGTSFIVPPRFQYVVIYTKMISHAHSERIESQISNKKIIPINIFNTRLVVNDIYNAVCTE